MKKHCENCEEVIPQKRVSISSRIRFCVDCQELYEKGDLKGHTPFVRSSMAIIPEIESWENVGVYQIVKEGSEVL